MLGCSNLAFVLPILFSLQSKLISTRPGPKTTNLGAATEMETRAGSQKKGPEKYVTPAPRPAGKASVNGRNVG